jgi:Cu(I)/Ag(I) efflux system membrane fusion protein/cobalt-zinc-cadmium efflux system membrane fusion protein
MNDYRTRFLLALVGNIALAAVLVGVWWHYRTPEPAVKAQQKDMAASGAQNSTEGLIPAAQAAPETPLAPVPMSKKQLQSMGVKTAAVERKTVEDELRTTGNIAVDESRLAYVQVRYSGYIEKVFVDATYQYVHKGQPLFTIYSPDVAATEREYVVAKQSQDQVALSSIPEVKASAAALLDAAAERLKQWGVPQTEIIRLDATGQAAQELTIESPISGYITERNALPSVAVQPEMRLYTIADLSTVWVQAQAFQGDLGRIKIGDPATLTVDAFPGRTFRGKVDFIYPQVDMDTRTAKVRVVFPNPGLELKPGMFVSVTLRIPMGQQLVIPASGVLQSGMRQIAFVDRADGYVEPREVELGARAGDDFIVLKGLKAGDQIVTSANFLIDSESQLQAALGAMAPPSSGAGAASALNTPQGSLDLVSEPSPPRKGSNFFRVKLTDGSGSPVPGADVTLVFFMPAMPAMGMAAVHASVKLADKGNGLYEGSGNLESGGTWQVTIAARKNGQAIASKQFSVNATGGM